MKKKVIIIGAGGHGRVIEEIIERNGDLVIGFLDDTVQGQHILGKTADCTSFKDVYFIIGVGNNAARQKIAEAYPDLQFYTAIDPSAIVSKSTRVGEGSCVMPGTVLNSGTEIGKHCIVNSHATVEHDTVLQDFVHISPGAVLCGSVKVGKGTHIGAGVVVRNQISIAGDCTVGIGAAVVQNLEKAGVYVGVPAQKIK